MWLTHLKKGVLIFGALMTAANSPATPAGLPLADGPDPYGPGVARLVASITEFSRWPDEKGPLKLCIIEPADHGDKIAPFAVSRGRQVQVARMDSASVRGSGCDAVYLGRMGLADQRALTEYFLGRPVLTIAENDPACRSRAMFCLIFGAASLSFRMNLDSVSRSGVRIDPRVLRLASPKEQM